MQAAVSAHVNMFQELAASFVEQQAGIVMKLQESMAQHMQTLQQQQIHQQKQIEDLKQQHAAATVTAKARVMEALSLALDTGFAQQSTVVNGSSSAMQASIVSSAESFSAAAVDFDVTASLSRAAASAYVSACAPIAHGFSAAAARMLEQNTEAADIISSQAMAAVDSAAAAHKCVAAAASKITETVASATADVNSANEKLSGDVEGRLKVTRALFDKSPCVVARSVAEVWCRKRWQPLLCRLQKVRRLLRRLWSPRLA
jgi:hypothetical protein